MTNKIAARILLIFLVTCSALTASAEEKSYTLKNKQWSVRIVPTLLGVWGKPVGINQELLLASPASAPEKIADLKAGKDRLSWRIPEKELIVEMRLTGPELYVRFTTSKEQAIEWPSTATDARAKAIIFPQNEGLYLPVRDSFWLEQIGDKACYNAHRVSMPFWGVEFDQAMVSYILPNDLRAKLCLRGVEGRIILTVPHNFYERDKLPAYELKIVLAQNSPIGPALAYRDWLMKTGRHVSFSEKIKENAEVEKLFGAMHAYLWGDGATPAAIRQLHELGIERAALFYDQDQRNTEKLGRTQAAIKAAVAFSYLMGPYETFANIQDPKNSDSFTSIYDEALFQTGGVMKSDGTRQKGFQGRGYELSSEALKRAKRPFIEERVNAHLQTGVNAVFLDVDAFGDLYDDYDPQHPMTLAEDRENRLERMRFISRTKRLVLGSESAVGWSAPIVAFSHGTQSLQTEAFWDLHRQRDVWGRWYPGNRPAFFFKTIDAPARFATAVYDPRYRLPLFEAVFHDSLVSTDFWGASLMKFNNLVRTRSLMLLLYNVPAIWNLDQKAISDYGKRIKAMNDFFAPLHRQVGAKPLTRFEWLTPDRMVQRTRFADDVELTANFGAEAFKNIPPLCIEAHWLKENRRQQYCPEP
ncbi:MAG TPA: glycoside hydrolase [Pyrinomonadaceae bacterium]